MRDRQGRLWYATLKGVSMVDPQKVQFDTNAPPVFIEQVRVEELSKKQRYILPSGAEPIIVPPGLGEIAVFFTALCYTAPEKVRFAYRIDGLNDSWEDIGNRRIVYFYPPPPGRYQIRVKAANADGVWNEEAATLSFVVLPFYWQTVWFRALVVAGCAAGTGGTVWRVLSAKIRRQHRAEQALRELARRLLRVQDQERRRIGRELHDSTGQTLAALEITLAMANKKADQLPPALRSNLAECAALASRCTVQIRTASYLLHPPLLEELGLASALHWLVDGFSQRSGIEVCLDLPEDLPRLGEEYELTLFRVAQEALTNVHRHSGGAKARVRLHLKAGRLELEVADDGHGIVPEKLGDLETGRKTLGVGVSGMRERLRQLGGDFQITASSAGTLVRVTLPWPQQTHARAVEVS